MKDYFEKSPHYLKIKKICFFSSVILIILLVIYMFFTLLSAGKLNKNIQLLTQHPFVVTRAIGDLRTDMAKMNIRTERLQSYNQHNDVLTVKNSLDILYQQMEEPLDTIAELYIGPKEDVEHLIAINDEIRKKQNDLLNYADHPDHSTAEIAEYEQTYVAPLYTEFDIATKKILDYARATQNDISNSATQMWRTTLFWSIVIALVTVTGLFFYQYILRKLNKEIFYKNQQFEQLSQTIDETFMIFNSAKLDCEFVAGNAQRVLGIAASELMRERAVIYRYMDKKTQSDILNSIKEKDESWEMTIQYANPLFVDQRWLLTRFYPIKGNSDNTRFLVTFTDRTDELRAQQALKDALINAQNANKAKRDFLSRMSHEIRTPMNAIIGMTTIAASFIEDRSRVEDCLSKIGYSSKHLLMLINDILDMSRIENNKMTINIEPFDMFQFINSFISIVYQQAQSKGLEFSETMVGFQDHATYCGDSLRINQILLNLTSNAIKFTEPGGKISLEVKRFPSQEQKERIRFIVKDTGIGMSEDALKRLYEPFEQANPTIVQKYGGTGLGMSITQNLVTLMGGHIEVKSELGVGTTCIVDINLEKSDYELNLLSPEAIEMLKVLIVDDEQEVCEHTSILLKKIHVQAKWVLTGKEAVKSVCEAWDTGNCFDVCFIDWKMPEMDGIETTRRIREYVGPNTPIIIITAYDWSEIEQEARAAGVNAFISKPLFLSSIYNTLINVTRGEFARSYQKPSPQVYEELKGTHLLIAEDNSLNLEILQELLQMNGIKSEGVIDGKQALEHFLASAPGYYDAILMDIQMPMMNGYEATRAIRNSDHEDAKTIPIIATTANAFSEDILEANLAGMNGHISKPVDMKSLCDILSQLIYKKM